MNTTSRLQLAPRRSMRMNLMIPSQHPSTLQGLWTFLPILAVYLGIATQREKFWAMRVW